MQLQLQLLTAIVTVPVTVMVTVWLPAVLAAAHPYSRPPIRLGSVSENIKVRIGED